MQELVQELMEYLPNLWKEVTQTEYSSEAALSYFLISVVTTQVFIL